jgi:5-methylcytosine-specific restriction endonuclease McrA
MQFMTNKKLCPKCLKKKSVDKFKPRPDGSISYCYLCEIGYYRTYNAKRYATPEARNQELIRTKERYHRLFKPARRARKKKLIMLMGGKCALCGYNRSAAALDFDHINPKTKKRTISHLLAVSQPWAWKAALKEAKKCQLICSNCHREKTYPGQEF